MFSFFIADAETDIFALLKPQLKGHTPYLFDHNPQLIKFVFIIRAAYIVYFFTSSNSTDDAQSFLSYVLSTKLFLHYIMFSSASCAHFITRGITMNIRQL